MAAPKRSFADLTNLLEKAKAKRATTAVTTTINPPVSNNKNNNVPSAPLPTISWSLLQIDATTTTASSSSQQQHAKQPLHLLNSATDYVKCTISHPNHPLAGFQYHLKQHPQAVQEARLLKSLHRPNLHPHILQVYATGQVPPPMQKSRDEDEREHDKNLQQNCSYFVLVEPWEETLRSRITRMAETKPSRRGGNSSVLTISKVISEIGLPLVRVLKFLHSRPRPISYNVLCMDSVGYINSLGGNSYNTTNGNTTKNSRHQQPQDQRLVLIDFSKATMSSNREEAGDDDHLHEAFDVWCLGKLLRDVLNTLRLSPASTAPAAYTGAVIKEDPLSALLEACCHAKPNQRPSLLRIQKRLLEYKEPRALTASANNSNATSHNTSFRRLASPKRFGKPNWTTKLPWKKKTRRNNNNYSMQLHPHATKNDAAVDVSTTTTSTFRTDDETIISAAG